MSLPEHWVAVDPGEDCGWSTWSGNELVDGGTDKLWEFGDAIWDEVFRQTGNPSRLPDELQPNPHITDALEGISLIVCEDWRLYPWVMRAGGLDWDECRTARLIGSLYQACRVAGWEWAVTQTKNKKDSKAAGAEALFVHPLKENRHTNDSRMAGWLHVLANQQAT